MHLEEYFEFLESGEIRLKGHRIGIEDVLYEYLCNDLGPRELADRFPTLAPAQIYATILYYHHNVEKVSRYVDEWIEHGNRMRELQKQNPAPVMIRLRLIAAQRKAGRDTAVGNDAA